jgi:hypothetical protein
MKVLKVFLVAILSFLLFLSLSIFGIAFLLNSTLLNPDFIADEVEKTNISELFIDIIEEQIDELPEELLFLKDAVYEIIAEHEPWLKEQLNNAIYTGYDYLLGKSDRLEINIPLEELKESLRDSLWRAFTEHLPTWLPELVEDDLGSYLDEHIHEFAEEIPSEYLPPEIVGHTEESLQLYLDQYLHEVSAQIDEDIIPEISGLLEVLIKPHFDYYYDEFSEEIPSELTLDESDISTEDMDQIILARKYIGYFHTVYYALIGFMVLLVLGIILIYRNVREPTRSLGISFLVYGVLQFVSVFIIRKYVPEILPLDDLPSSLQTWLTGLYSDFLAPLQWLSLGILIFGIALLVVSFVYKRRKVDDEIDEITESNQG